MPISAVTRKRRALRFNAAPQPPIDFGHIPIAIPPGSRKLSPVQSGDQGISPHERAHAEKAIKALFKKAPGVMWIATFHADTGEYEIRSRTGSIKYTRWATPDGTIFYQIASMSGENPVPSMDPRRVATLEEEIAAAGGAGKPVPHEKTSYPDIFRRIAQIFDHRHAPDFVHIPGGGADPNHPGTGSHGIPDMTQSRAPLIIAGPGIAAGRITDQPVRNVDVAPTLAHLLGVKPVMGTDASGKQQLQYLRWQDGKPFLASIADASVGASGVDAASSTSSAMPSALYGVADRAFVFVLDGASQTVLMDEVRAGRLPNIARVMNAGTTFRYGSLSDYPVVTWSNHNTIATGTSPGHHGLINNSWYVRDEQREQLITDGSKFNTFRTGRHMEKGVETLYEAVRRTFGSGAVTYAGNEPSGRGATLSTLDLTGIGKFLAHGISTLGEFLKGKKLTGNPIMAGSKEYKSVVWQDNLATSLGVSLIKGKSTPKLGIIEFAVPDNQAHEHGPQSPQARAALQEADAHIGRLLKALTDRGVIGSTAFVVTADHGMEHQYTDKNKVGGWKKALEKSGVKAIESTRFVYLRTMRVDAKVVDGKVLVSVVDDDADKSGSNPPVAGALVTVRDAHGRTVTGVTTEDGSIQIPIGAGMSGSVTVIVEHPELTRHESQLDLSAR